MSRRGPIVVTEGQAPVPSMTEGVFYLGAVADPDRSVPELFEDNNGRAGNLLVVQP